MVGTATGKGTWPAAPWGPASSGQPAVVSLDGGAASEMAARAWKGPSWGTLAIMGQLGDPGPTGLQGGPSTVLLSPLGAPCPHRHKCRATTEPVLLAHHGRSSLW